MANANSRPMTPFTISAQGADHRKEWSPRGRHVDHERPIDWRAPRPDAKPLVEETALGNSIYQRMIAACREPDRTAGRRLMKQLIDSVRTDVPAALSEVTTLGRTLTKRATDVVAYFEGPRHLQRTHQRHQRPPRTPPRLHPRLAQPHQLHRQITRGNRRIQTRLHPQS